MKTKKSLNFLFLMLVGTIVFSCVENYQEANPPRLKDAPAVASVTSSASQIFDGASDLITINVVDAPAGIDSIGYSITDEQGDMSGTVSFNNLATLKGKTKGEVLATYTSEKNKAVTVTLTFTVFDKQISEGKVVRKSSVPQSMVIEVICPSDLAGTYTTVTSGTSSDPGANMQTVTNLASQVTLMATSTPGEYSITDISGGIYDAWYLGVYYNQSSQIPAKLKDACGNVTVKEFTGSPFNGDGVGSSDGSVNSLGVISITVTNVFGDQWKIVMTPK